MGCSQGLVVALVHSSSQLQGQPSQGGTPTPLLSFRPTQQSQEPQEQLSLPASLSQGLFSGASGCQMQSPELAFELAGPAIYSILQLNPRSNISLTTLSGQRLIMAYI